MNNSLNTFLPAGTQQQLIEHLSACVTERRLELFKKVLNNRTRYVTVVLEDIYQSHNQSAAMRTCDCLGIQDVHLITNNYNYDVNDDIALGASQWLTIRQHGETNDNTEACLRRLKSDGYRIVATTPHRNDVSLPDFDCPKGKFALVFGTELEGISETAKQMADEFVKIPMHGFTESYNISVSVALCIYHFTQQIRQLNLDWHLTEPEKNELLLNWLRSSVKESALIEERFLKSL